MQRHFLPAAALLAALASVPQAQLRVVPLDEEKGHVALGLALRHLANAGIYMMATAHPDDENNGLLVMLNRGQGYRTALASATRGNGGQNEIGPELFEPLGVLRTEELAALHRFDGAEQYFTRAVDFGYTIDINETLAQWGREEIVGDYVRLIRTIRPDVISTMSPTALGPGQHAHHAASAILSQEAYKLAGDPTKYPEQIEAGLRVWQPKKLYSAVGGQGAAAPARVCRLTLSGFDQLLGRTYSEIGTEARSMHKCQGQAQLLALPAPVASNFQLADTTIPGQKEKDERSFFDGVDTSIPGIAALAGAQAPRDLNEGLSAIASSVQAAQRNFDTQNDGATLQPLISGLRAVRALRSSLPSMQIDEAARFDIDFRLRQKENEFQQAILVANGVRIEALADDGVVTPGQPVKVTLIVANRGAAEVGLKQVKFDGLGGEGTCEFRPAPAGGGPGGGGAAAAAAAAAAAQKAPPLTSLKADQIGRCEVTLVVPPNARITEPYWRRPPDSGRYMFDADAPFGLPFRPTPFYAQITLTFSGGEDVSSGMPIQYRYEGDIFSGEKRSELLVAPPLSVSISPDVAIIPEASVRVAQTPARGGAAGAASSLPASEAREVRVTVVNDSRGSAESEVRLALPEGWTATPVRQIVQFSREDESRTVRFQVRPAPNTEAGDFHVKGQAIVAGRTFDRGFQVIEYPHIRRRHFYNDADATVKVLDVKATPNLIVGYVMGTGDEVPPFIEQLGAKVELIGAEGLAWGDLSRYTTIMLGVRAYEKRDDLRANNSRLLEYVENGGTVIVQYNRAAINDAYGPYPAKISNDRITDEHAPVRVLEPAHPVFTTPNQITGAAWVGWVQERGLNFLGEKDSRYRDLVQLADSFPNNPGDKRGALVEAVYGKGRWLYLALGLWRELPAGVDGAYPILANLISLGAQPPAPAQASGRGAPAEPAR